jgi:hypothetical protein
MPCHLRVIVGSLRAELHGRLAAIVARVSPGRAPFASMEDLGAALGLTMRVRDQAAQGPWDPSPGLDGAELPGPG